MNDEISFLTLADKKLAYQQRRRSGEGAGENKCGVVFLGGYGSDMTGAKATFLAERCVVGSRRLPLKAMSAIGRGSAECVSIF